MRCSNCVLHYQTIGFLTSIIEYYALPIVWWTVYEWYWRCRKRRQSRSSKFHGWYSIFSSSSCRVDVDFTRPKLTRRYYTIAKASLSSRHNWKPDGWASARNIRYSSRCWYRTFVVEHIINKDTEHLRHLAKCNDLGHNTRASHYFHLPLAL